MSATVVTTNVAKTTSTNWLRFGQSLYYIRFSTEAGKTLMRVAGRHPERGDLDLNLTVAEGRQFYAKLLSRGWVVSNGPSDDGLRADAKAVTAAPAAPVFTPRQVRNDRSGEVLTTEVSDAEALRLFAETARPDNWLWFWLHKHVSRLPKTVAEQQATGGKVEVARTPMDDAMDFLADWFTLAVGYGLKRPMLRTHFRDQRFKFYLSRKGTLCLKSGMLAVNDDGSFTHDPVGDEFYVGCLMDGRFRVATERYQDNNGRWRDGPERKLTATETEFLTRLSASPVSFLAECSKDMQRCCYCNLPLSDERSMKIGYGEVCAHRYGMPWGNDKAMETAPSFAKVYGPDAHHMLVAIRTTEDEAERKVAWLELADWLDERGLPRCQSPEDRGNGRVQLPRA